MGSINTTWPNHGHVFVNNGKGGACLHAIVEASCMSSFTPDEVRTPGLGFQGEGFTCSLVGAYEQFHASTRWMGQVARKWRPRPGLDQTTPAGHPPASLVSIGGRRTGMYSRTNPCPPPSTIMA